MEDKIKSSYEMFKIIKGNENISFDEFGVEYLSRLLASEKIKYARYESILTDIIFLKRDLRNNIDSTSVEYILNKLEDIFDD